MEVGRCMLMDGVALEQAPYVPTTSKRLRPDPTPAKASKAVASRYYQLRMGHALIGPYLKKIGKRASDTNWWCDRGVNQSREHCSRAARSGNPNSHPVGRGPAGDQEVEGQVQICELFVEEQCGPAVLDFLRSAGVGKTVLREDGEDEEEDQGVCT